MQWGALSIGFWTCDESGNLGSSQLLLSVGIINWSSNGTSTLRWTVPAWRRSKNDATCQTCSGKWSVSFWRYCLSDTNEHETLHLVGAILCLQQLFGFACAAICVSGCLQGSNPFGLLCSSSFLCLFARIKCHAEFHNLGQALKCHTKRTTERKNVFLAPVLDVVVTAVDSGTALSSVAVAASALFARACEIQWEWKSIQRQKIFK